MHFTEIGWVPAANYACASGTLDGDGGTALHDAAFCGETAMMELLLGAPTVGRPHGALVNFKNTGGQTALHLAAYSGGLAAVQVLLKHGADSTVQDERGRSPLDLYVKQFVLGSLEDFDTDTGIVLMMEKLNPNLVETENYFWFAMLENLVSSAHLV
jgi:ankyrin repeat protein